MNNRLKFKQLFDALLPQSCLLCASPCGGKHGFCKECLQDLPWHSARQCPQCGLPSDGAICGSCLNSPPSFDATRALFSYEYPVNRLLQHYKYRESLHLASTFSSLFIHAPRSIKSTTAALIIPMPMHHERLKQRGFNQALEIARHLARQLEIELDFTSCRRTKLTPPQASLPLKERIRNIQGVFNCSRNLDGLNIALVDDVMTTGASLNELAKTLKQAGAAHVECWVVARTLPQPY